MYDQLKDKENRNILVPGSHDAGIMESGTAPDQTITQKYSIAQQMCRGFRYFDIRVKQKGLVKSANLAKHPFYLLHPSPSPLIPNGWADTWDNVSF